MKLITPTTFMNRLIKKNELGQPFGVTDHQGEALKLAFAFDEDGPASLRHAGLQLGALKTRASKTAKCT